MENNRYNNSKIYKLVDLVNGYFYIGSTCNPLSKRLSWHKQNAKKDRYNNRKVYKYFNSIGWEKVKIVLITENYLDNKEQLLREEDNIIQMYIHDEKCLNCNRAFTTTEEKKEQTKQYHFEHKEEIKQKRKQYYLEHKDDILQKDKQYVLLHKNEISQRQKNYRDNHKEEIKEQKKQYYNEHNNDILKNKQQYYLEHKVDILQKHKEKIICSCGSTITKAEKARHERTKKHQAWLHDQQQTGETI